MTEIYDNYPLRNLLTRHPQPFRGLESLRGYVLRLTESNGYDSAWKVYVQAGLKQFEMRGAGFRVGKLALICNCSPIELQSIAYSQAAQPHFRYLLGEAVRVTDLEFSTPRICPKCIHRFGYIQGCWDLRFMIGCPIHDVQALSLCPSCGDSLSWYRRSMLTCSCGAALDDVDLAPLEPSERALLDLIYSKALNLLPFPDPQSRLPLVELSQMRLRMLLSVVQTIGTCWARTIALKSEAIGPQQIVESAARAFSDWPDNYFRLLTALARREFGNRYDIRQQFAPLYSALLKERGGTDSIALEFLRRAFIEFIGSHQTIRAADPRLMSEIQEQVQMRYQTRAALARSLRVDPRAVTRLLLTHENSERGVPRFAPVDSSEFSLTGAMPSRILTEREASAKLGVPVSAFRKLVASGVYRKKHRLPGQAGYDERDVNEMLSRLLAKVEPISQELDIASSVSLGEVMRMKRYSVAEKCSLIVAIASGDPKSFAEREAPDFRSVQISTRSLSDFIAGARASSNTVAASQAANALGCATETLKILIRLGQLDGIKSSQQWLIARQSLNAFQRAFVKLSATASELRTSSRRLMVLCRANRIELLCARSSPRRQEVFIHRNAQEKLRIAVRLQGQ